MFSANTSQVSGDALYVEDVFSTYLYTGDGVGQTITNGINLSGKGGLVWIKGRNGTQYGNANHALQDSARGVTYTISSDLTNAQSNQTTGGVTSFNSNGFTIGDYPLFNDSGYNYVSWTFRKQPKFFDVVTFTSDSSGGATFSHSLGSSPGCILIKNTFQADAWHVYHRSTGVNSELTLNSNAAAFTNTGWISVSDTSVTVASGMLNASNTQVAYLFAHDTASDGVIQCGSFAGNSGTVNVELGWEPQFVLARVANATSSWVMMDIMRGMPAPGSTAADVAWLQSESSAAESLNSDFVARPTATGFQFRADGYSSSFNIIYIAIRRGPMRTPTSGTSVFSPQIWTGNATARTITGTNNPVDLSILTIRDSSGNGGDKLWNDRLRGASATLYSNYTQAEDSQPTYVTGFDVQYGEKIGTALPVNGSGVTYVSEMVSRAPGFFDEVCYTGTGAATTQAHNLGVAPELMIVKSRSGLYDWRAYSAATGVSKYLTLNSTQAEATTSSTWNDTSPTSSVFTVGTSPVVNSSGDTYVAYLFASCPGVSKVGSFTGTGSTLQINCGFTGGARFVLIKRTDSTGDWFYWDSARGIVAGSDPYLRINDGNPEVTGTDFVDAYSAGFELTNDGGNNVNINGASYIYLAIA